MNSDKLRTLTEARRFAADFFSEGKPVFVICHGAQIPIDCELVEGRKNWGPLAMMTLWVRRSVVSGSVGRI